MRFVYAFKEVQVVRDRTSSGYATGDIFTDITLAITSCTGKWFEASGEIKLRLYGDHYTRFTDAKWTQGKSEEFDIPLPELPQTNDQLLASALNEAAAHLARAAQPVATADLAAARRCITRAWELLNEMAPQGRGPKP